MKLTAVDMFCGAGGTSTALLSVAARLGYSVDLAAINHWPVAIQTHTKNHPEVRHFCERIEMLDPRQVVPSGKLDLLVASPECTHHSNARGGRPLNDQSRATAHRVTEWCDRLYVRDVLIENVPEFRTWGPIGANGRPLKSKKGMMFEEYLRMFQAMNYRVEHRVLNAADYGDPQTRRRLFIRATRGNKKIVWPDPTHAKVGTQGGLFGELPCWRPARDIIDWSLIGESIFTRKRPLARKTLERIEAGLRKFGGPNVGPFLVVLRRHMDGMPIDGPLPTLAAEGTHIGLAEPCVTRYRKGEQIGVDSPLGTVVCKDAFGIVNPVLVEVRNTGANGIQSRPVDEPMQTVCGQISSALAEPFILPHQMFMEDGADSIESPLRTVTATNGRCHRMVEPVLVEVNHGNDDRTGNLRRSASVDEPLKGVTCSNGKGIADPVLVPRYGEREGQEPRSHSVDEPVPTVAATNAPGLATPVVLRTEHGDYGLDIRFRMLKPHELAAAQSFPPDYEFAGNAGDVVRQIGNAVPVRLGEALVEAMIA